MKSIFVRIYGSMLVALLFVGAVFYFTIDAISNSRAEQYRKQLARGPFTLLAEGAAYYRGEERTKWLQGIARSMGMNYRLTNDAGLNLTSDQIESLKNQDVVILKLDDSEYSRVEVIAHVPTNEDLYIRAQLDQLSEQQARGSALLVLDTLSRYPVEEWAMQLDRMHRFFGFDLARMSPKDLKLDQEQNERLFERGEVVVSLDDHARDHSSLKIYTVLPETGEVLVLGPITFVNWLSTQALIVMGLISIAVIGLAIWLLVRPLEIRLKNLESALRKVRKGDFTVRTFDNSQDAVSQLSAAFNSMIENLQTLMDSQKEMIRAVSHELRTPVQRIRFGLENMLDAVDDEQRLSKIDDIHIDIDELDKLIDEILTYSKLEQSQPQLEFTLIDIDELLKRIKKESEALGSGVKIEYVSPNLPLERRLAEGEERYIHRVVQNFVGNAIRYAKSNVRISFGMVGEIFRIDVEDDGMGIPEKDRERVFKPFARLDDSRARSSGGYGLGLSIVQRIAYWHGGNAKVAESALGGAKFTIIWPRSQKLREPTKEDNEIEG